MKFTLENVINSLAGVLMAQYPYPVYESPNQQGTDFPCFFIFFMPSKVGAHLDERFLWDLGIDIVFVQQKNLVNGNTEIHKIAQYLDESLETFPYLDDSCKSACIRTYEREWQIEDGELHYKFHIRQRVSVPRNDVMMQRMEENSAEVKK